MFDRRLLSNFDWYFLGLVLAISLMGVLAIASASEGYPDENGYWTRQLTWLGVALVAGFFVLLVDFRTIGAWSYGIHGLVVLLLAALLVFDPSGSGVNRWFVLGPVAIQPSEFAKLSAVLAVSYYFRDRRTAGLLGVRELLVPVLLVAVPCVLIVRQPDLGTGLLLLLGTAPVVLLAGVRLRILVSLAGATVVALAVLVGAFQLGVYRIPSQLPQTLAREGADPALIARVRAAVEQEFPTRSAVRDAFFDGPRADQRALLEVIARESFRPYISHVLRPYQQKRLLTFLSPEKDPLGSGYHVIQSKVAIGSGGMWGKGYGNSTQGALNFLPARHTDFVFSIFAEEWGFFGVFVLLTLYVLFFLRGIRLILATRDRFSAFLIMGVFSIIAAQVMVNTGMVVGLLPVVGVPLPFFSYGGSSMVTLMVGVALVLNIRMRRFLWV